MSILTRIRDWLRPATARTVHDGYGPAILRQGGPSAAPDIDGKLDAAREHLEKCQAGADFDEAQRLKAKRDEEHRRELKRQLARLKASQKRAEAAQARETVRNIRSMEGGKR